MQWTLEQQLLAAVANEKIGDVATLLKKGADPNTRSVHFGMTPLMYAVSYNNSRIVRTLIAGGADVNFVSKLKGNKRFDNGSAIFFAPTGSMMQLLLSAGADPNTIGDVNSNTPLEDIVDNQIWDEADASTLQRINLLLQYGAVPKVYWLFRYYRDSQAVVLEMFLKAGADIDEPNAYGHTGLENTFSELAEDAQLDGPAISPAGTYAKIPLLKAYILNGATLDPSWIESFHPDDKAQILADARWAKLRQILILREYLKSVGDVPGSSAAASKYFKQGSPE